MEDHPANAHTDSSAPRSTAAPLIAAIATPAGRGGVGIVRASGDPIDSLIVGVVGRRLEPRRATHVIFRAANGSAIDEGLALFFPRPHSYTGEDVVEWHGHGGPAVTRLLLARCLELGARIAEPGEFTKRAFLNGKLDLAQAESVADVIEASTATAVRAAARTLTGDFSREVHALRDALIDLRVYTEATLDFPDEDLDLLREGGVQTRLATIRERLEALIARARTGALLREGLTIVLVGAPNVGKSSLLNCLAREDAAIVTAVPGTTRDTIERRIDIGGIPLTIVDTAGLRETSDTVEALGIARTREAIGRADLALLLIDARDDGDADDAVIAIERELANALPRIVVHNKCDLAQRSPRIEKRDDGHAHVWLCALTGQGIDLLEGEIQHLAGVDRGTEDAFIARTRHLVALNAAAQHLGAAAEHAHAVQPPLELFAEELRYAQDAFSTITGEFTADDLLGEIFSRFCIGK